MENSFSYSYTLLLQLSEMNKLLKDRKRVHTWCNRVDESSDSGTIVPVCGEVVDGFVWDLVLYPPEQALFGCFVLSCWVLLLVPHWHGDTVVQDECPYQTQDELQLTINNVSRVCNTTQT